MQPINISMKRIIETLQIKTTDKKSPVTDKEKSKIDEELPLQKEEPPVDEETDETKLSTIFWLSIAAIIITFIINIWVI